MAYVALKPCCFAGHRFRIGEIVPDEYVHPGNANNAIKMGLIATQDGTAAPAARTGEETETHTVETMTVNIHAEEGDLPLNLTAEGLQAVVDVLTSKVEDAEPIVEAMTDGDALILLHLADYRKGIKTAAEARAKALNDVEAEETEETEEETDESAEAEETEESAGEQ